MAKEERFEELANSVLGLIGGKDNIIFFTHCVTRLRFNLKDKGMVKIEEIEKIKGVIGVQWQGEQLQIIIGQAVGDAYNLICSKAGLKQEDAIDENLDKNVKKKISAGLFIDSIAGCLTPLIPLLIGGGLVKVVVLLLTQVGILTADMPTYTTLTFVGDAAFYFLPVFVGATAAKKFGANMGLGMLLGAILIHPTFVAMVTAGSAGSIYGIPISARSYSSTIFPVIISVYVMSKIEKFVAKHSPDAIRSITEPLITILIMVPLTLCILAPIGAVVGDSLGTAISWLYSTCGFVAVMLLAAVYPFIIMTGMHVGLTPILLNSFATVGYDPIICVANFISNFNQGAASAAVAIKSKNTILKSTASSCAITAIVGGVTEPAMFGITIKYKTPLYGCMLGGLAGGLFAGLTHVYLYAFPGSGGLFGLPAFIGPTASNIIFFIIAIAIGMITTFVATLFLYKETKTA